MNANQEGCKQPETAANSRWARWSVVLLVAALCLLPLAFIGETIYARMVNRILAAQLDREIGKQNWVVLGTVADGQCGEELRLFRTVYLKYCYYTDCKRWYFLANLTSESLAQRPISFLTDGVEYFVRNFTKPPCWKLRFNKEGPKAHWHYVITVITKEAEITYFWSIRESKWQEVWKNDLKILEPDTRKTTQLKLSNLARKRGLNFAVNEISGPN